MEWPAHLPLVRGGGVSYNKCNLIPAESYFNIFSIMSIESFGNK